MQITCALSPQDLRSVKSPTKNPNEELALGEKFEYFRETHREVRIDTRVRVRAYHVVIIDAGRCRQEQVRVLPRRITDADERSLITLAVRILSLALDARRSSLDRLYARTLPATNNSLLASTRPIRRRIARITWNYNSCPQSNNNRDESTRRLHRGSVSFRLVSRSSVKKNHEKNKRSFSIQCLSLKLL